MFSFLKKPTPNCNICSIFLIFHSLSDVWIERIVRSPCLLSPRIHAYTIYRYGVRSVADVSKRAAIIHNLLSTWPHRTVEAETQPHAHNIRANLAHDDGAVRAVRQRCAGRATKPRQRLLNPYYMICCARVMCECAPPPPRRSYDINRQTILYLGIVVVVVALVARPVRFN